MKTVYGEIPIKGIKRCYVEGAVFKIACPNCKNTLKADLSDSYLSYPEVGGKSNVYFYCEKCADDDVLECEWIVTASIKSADLVIEYDPTKVEPA